jgi:signal transduction histidine kinase
MVLLLIKSTTLQSQKSIIDSLRANLNRSKPESVERATALGGIADYYAFLQFDSCISYSAKTIELSEKINFLYGMYLGYLSSFHGMNCQGNYPKALDAALNLQRVTEKLKKDSPWVYPYASYYTGVLYRAMEDYPRAIAQFKETIELQKKFGSLGDIYASFSQLANIYVIQGRLNSVMFDSALYYGRIAYDLGRKASHYPQFVMLSTTALGNVHLNLNHADSAGLLFHRAIEQCHQFENAYFEAQNYNFLASLFVRTNVRDSILWYAHKALQLCQTHHFTEFTLIASRTLATVYEGEKNADSTLKYLKMVVAAKDSIFSQAKVRQFQQETFNEIQRLERTQNRLRIYGLSAAMVLFLLLAFIMFRSARHRKKAAARIEKAYQELKATQALVIQSEKMASLGEITAGIAHEIQNPLNFVNNFSEVNKELLAELNEEIENGNYGLAKKFVTDIAGNEDKISHHGKRADSIVKGMMQHSRNTSTVKEPTDINALADEYLRLAYHGFRAKDKSFNATMKTYFDQNIGSINIIPQDIGRVLLNLYNNAFYTVLEKKKQALDGYEPTVNVTTKKLSSKVMISVKDNGGGIPQKIVDKIFQPFFTTKPAGQGTGLGLSLSYDIIKAHGGDIRVETKEGEGSEFIIQLPNQA